MHSNGIDNLVIKVMKNTSWFPRKSVANIIFVQRFYFSRGCTFQCFNIFGTPVIKGYGFSLSLFSSVLIFPYCCMCGLVYYVCRRVSRFYYLTMSASLSFVIWMVHWYKYGYLHVCQSRVVTWMLYLYFTNVYNVECQFPTNTPSGLTICFWIAIWVCQFI